MKRRDIIKNLATLPILGTISSQESIWAAEAQNTITEPLAGDSIYSTIGVEPIINCRGTFTIIGGSMERPEVGKAMEAATGYFVQYDELAFGVGKKLAELTKTEWGMVTSGCAAGMKHFTAACITGGNPEKLLRIPDLTGFEKTEVIIPRASRNQYDHAIRVLGVTIIHADTPQELEKAINSKTAMIYIMTGPAHDKDKPLSLEVIAGIAKAHNVPVLADAAAENLTIPPVHLERGATAVVYSGGKAICGPQCAGLLFGPKKLLMSAWQASAPHHGPGRDNKVGKEEVMGMLAAVEAWTKRDHKAEWDNWLKRLDTISNKVKQISGITTDIKIPTELSNLAPVLNIWWNPDELNITGEEVAEDTARNKPRIAIGSSNKDGKTGVNITPSQMREEQVAIVADRLYNLLAKKRPSKSNNMIAPSVKVGGPWDLEMQYFSSTSRHSLYLEQDGNWIHGHHEAEFDGAEIIGMVEGNNIKMKSVLRQPGDFITYLFNGKMEDDSITGTVFLGEYLTANFKATKSKYKIARKAFMIPGGPPLAT
jgi:D-glucosaminate-6-phosphate ammonia-lyase